MTYLSISGNNISIIIELDAPEHIMVHIIQSEYRPRIRWGGMDAFDYLSYVAKALHELR